MASEWAEEADRQAQGITRDLIEVGKRKGFRVAYQKREARFALRAGATTSYFSAHDYQTPHGIDWLRLRIDVLTRVRGGTQDAASAGRQSEVESGDAVENELHGERGERDAVNGGDSRSERDRTPRFAE